MQIKSIVAWEGLETALKAKLEAINKAVSEGIKATIPAHVEKVGHKARSLAPVDTGLLVSAIETKVSKGGHYGQVRINEQKAPHGHLILYGTVKSAPNPFLFQARDALEGELKTNLEKNIKEALKKG
jgi:HK97 gp10 family phage protein